MNRDDNRVRERAYFIWEGEGRVHGRAEIHWLRAEAEVAAPAPILTVQPVAEASLAPSLAKTLKPKAGRAKAAATAENPAGVAAKTAAKAVAKTAAKTAAKAVSKTAPKSVAKSPKALAPAALVAKPKAARAATAASLH